MKKEFTKKEQYIIAGAIGAGIILMFYVMFVLVPLLKKIVSLSKQEKTISQQLKKAATVNADMEKLYKEVEDITKKIERFEEKLPNNAELPLILDELIKIGKGDNITFVSIEPQPIKRITVGEDGKGYMEIPVRLRMKCGFHEFARFVNGIENHQRFMKTDNIEIKNDSKNAKEHDISMTVSAFALMDNNGTQEK